MIQLKTARDIAGEWNGGEWSALYQYSSAGYIVENHLRYLQEVESCLHPEFGLHPFELKKHDLRDLTNLRYRLIKEGEKNGIKTIYKDCSVSGYSIPYLSTDIDSGLFAKVIRPGYPV